MTDKLDNFFRPVDPTFYLPGDPRITNYIHKLQRLAFAVSGLPPHQRPNRMYLSSKDYGAVLAEARAQYDATGPDPGPGGLVFGKRVPFSVLNAGTDDQAEVNRLNREVPGAIDFADRMRQFDVVH